MMTVARRNRRWTPELREKLKQEVNAYLSINPGISKNKAYAVVSPSWGITPETVENVVNGWGTYGKAAFKAKMKYGAGTPAVLVPASTDLTKSMFRVTATVECDWNNVHKVLEAMRVVSENVTVAPIQ